MLIAIPDLFWSVELPLDLTINELHEELLMQFLIFILKMKPMHSHVTFVIDSNKLKGE